MESICDLSWKGQYSFQRYIFFVMRKSFQRALLKVSVALTRLMTQMASTPTILHIQVGNLMIYLKSSSKICWEFQFSFLLPRSLWVNISVKEGRLRCWQGIFHKIKFWLHVTDVWQLNVFHILPIGCFAILWFLRFLSGSLFCTRLGLSPPPPCPPLTAKSEQFARSGG